MTRERVSQLGVAMLALSLFPALGLGVGEMPVFGYV